MSGPILFTCPATKMVVQHWLDDGDEVSEDDYEGVDFTACESIHFINRRTGKVLGSERS